MSLDKTITEPIHVYSEASKRVHVDRKTIHRNEAVLRDFFHFLQSSDYKVTIEDLRETNNKKEK